MKIDNEDLSGRRFGKWTVIKKGESKGYKTYYWCICDSGTLREVREQSLLSGISKSCGCWHIESMQKECGKASFTNLYLRYKNSAKYRNLNFELSKKEFAELTSSKCHYCGCQPYLVNEKPEFKNGLYTYNGIDRIDNTLGYLLNNVVPCCKNCNKAKQGMSEKEFLEWAEKIYHYLLKEGII